MNRSNASDYSVISRYRNITMGLAAILIVIFHSYNLNLDLSFLIGDTIISKLINTGFIALRQFAIIGVDVFLVLSGLGLYYSYSKDSSLRSFYCKRALRILPPLLLVSIPWYAFFSDVPFFKGVLLISFFDKDWTHWYFFLCILLYAVYPLIHRMADRFGLRGIIIACAAVVAVSVLLWLFASEFYRTVYVALDRIPAFLLGTYLGKLAYEKKPITKRTARISLVLLIAMTILCPVIFILLQNTVYNYFRFFVHAVYAVLLVLMLSVWFERRPDRPHRMLAFFGGLSMYLYLLYEKTATIFVDFIHEADHFGFSFYLTVFVITLVLSIILKEVCARITQIWEQDAKSK